LRPTLSDAHIKFIGGSCKMGVNIKQIILSSANVFQTLFLDGGEYLTKQKN
jgi:hypothetical protein